MTRHTRTNLRIGPNSDRRVGRNPPCRTRACRPRRSAHRRAPARDLGPGLRAAAPRGHDARRSRRAVRRLSCVQLDSISTVERSHRIALGGTRRRVPARRRSPAPRRRAPDRVLGARGVPAAGRGLAALPARDGGRRAPLVRRGRPHAPAPPRARPRRDPRRAGRSARGTSTARRGRARCGAGSRRSRCSSCSGTTASSWSRAGRGSSALYDLPERVLPRDGPRRADAARAGAPARARPPRGPRARRR